LGDLLLQIVFHAQIASEDNEFDINDVITVSAGRWYRGILMFLAQIKRILPKKF